MDLTRLVTLLAAMSVLVPASAETTQSNALSVDTEDVPFDLGRSCFLGNRASYDDWSHGLLDRNQEVVDKLLTWFDKTFKE